MKGESKPPRKPGAIQNLPVKKSDGIKGGRLTEERNKHGSTP
jgi:hypothetical protein